MISAATDSRYIGLSWCILTLNVQMGGPIWVEPIHDPVFVSGLLGEVNTAPQSMYKTVERMKGFLTVISEVRVCSV